MSQFESIWKYILLDSVEEEKQIDLGTLSLRVRVETIFSLNFISISKNHLTFCSKRFFNIADITFQDIRFEQIALYKPAIQSRDKIWPAIHLKRSISFFKGEHDFSSGGKRWAVYSCVTTFLELETWRISGKPSALEKEECPCREETSKEIKKRKKEKEKSIEITKEK